MSRIRCLMFQAMAVLLLALSPAVYAQTETGQITGKVTDPNGAVVQGAAAVVKAVETGAERTATTNEEGVYTITNLQPGLYEITVEAANFAKAIQRVQVTVGAKAAVTTTLNVNAIAAATVDVVAGGGAEVNTQNQELSNVVTGTQIRELPTITRNPYDLVKLSGNAATDDPSTSQNEAAGTATWRGTGASINGQRASSTNILLDGTDNNNTFTASIGQNVPLDAVQEFRVVTSNFSAEYGRATGGIVNVATRSGSNDFHGAGYEFNRISRLASNGFDNNAKGLTRGVFTRNQFGYSLGGRIIRDKLFFFNSTEWTRVRSGGPATAFVPTSQLIAASSPATQGFFNAYKLAATPTGRIATAGSLGIDGLAASTPAFQEVSFNIPQDLGGGLPQNAYQSIFRVDYNRSSATQIYGRYAVEKQDLFEGTVGFSPYQGFSTGSNAFRQNALISFTRTFSARFVSQTKLAFNRLTTLSPLGEQPPGPSLYATAGRASIGGTLIAMPGYLPFSPGQALPSGGPTNNGQVYQDFNYEAGKHQFRFGGQYVYIQSNRTFGAYLNSVETLGNNLTQALNNLVGGQIVEFDGAINPQGKFPGEFVSSPFNPPSFTRSNRYHEYALYFNDAYRVKPGLVLNLGLRYEYYGVQHNKDASLDSNFYFGPGNSLQEQIRNGSVQRAPDSSVGGLWKPDRNNFAPRVGFAWDVNGDGKTSLRGGYGIAYERNFGNVTFNVIQNPPNYAVVSLIAPTDVPSLGLTANNLGPLAGSGLTTRLPAVSLRAVRPDITNAYAHFWSLAFERELAPGTVASVEYSGSAGRSLYTLENFNRNGTGPVYLGSRATTPTGGTSSRLNGQYGNINARANNGFSNYNALIFGIESNNWRRLGLQFTANYTYSVTKDNLSSTFSDANFQQGNLGLLDPFNPKLDYGYADFDVRHRFVASFNYEVPYFNKLDNKMLRGLLGGFTLTGIINARTGLPFTVYDCTNALPQACPRLVPAGALSFSGSGNPAVDSSGPNQFRYLDLPGRVDFNNAVAGNSSVGPFPTDMTKRNAFRGPGFYNIDAGLYKRIRLTERYSLQLRMETYNLLNHSNLFVIGTNTDVSAFTPATNFIQATRGVFPSGNLERRNVQLALKFIF